MSSMLDTIVPKSDQLNADDLIGRDMTITVTDVAIRGGQEQPVSIHFDGDNGKPYKACKSMCRVLVTAWGADAKKYIGRSLTLYRDPTVKWGGMEVGGIRISHMSDIDAKITMALTMSKSNRKPYTVQPLKAAPPTKAAPLAPPSSEASSPATPAGAIVAATLSEFDKLVAKAQEMAEQGTVIYADWWKNLLSAEQRKQIGVERHDKFKDIAARVPS